MANFKVPSSIQNLATGSKVNHWTYDFVVSESSLCKYGVDRAVPVEHQADNTTIAKYLNAQELGELDGSHLLLLEEVE